MEPAALLQQALAHHQAGRLEAAAAAYRQVLAAQPGHAEALHRLGLIAYQQGRPADAVRLIGQAIAQDGAAPGMHSNLGLALADLGRHAEAVASYDRALALRPDHVGALSNRGIALRLSGRPAEAAASLRRALALRPDLVEAHSNLGQALADLGDLPEALACHERAIALRPGYAVALANRAATLAVLGRPEEATAGYAQAIAAGLDTAAIHLAHGLLLARLGTTEGALAAFDRAAARDPAVDDVYIARAALLAEHGRPVAALADYDRLIARHPAMAEAHSGRGAALRALGRPEEALAAHDHALALRPDLAGAHINHGIALAALGRRAEAAAAAARAAELEPDNALAHSNLARERVALGDMPAAAASLERALALDPTLVEARLNQALLDLLQGRLAEGLRGFECRWQTGGFTSPQRGFAQPRWHGEPLAGHTLLLHAEQGLGDTIQFARYVPLVAERAAREGGRVVFEVPRSLLPLFGGCFPGVQLVAAGGSLPAFDLHCPLMSLAAVFGTDLATIPPPLPGLRADPGRAAAWAERLHPALAPRVGLVWAGNPKHAEDRSRSLPLSGLLPLLGCGAALFALQPEVRPADRAVLAATPAIVDLGGALADFGDTAAAVAALDLVISVDTSVAHLAASLGKPTWVLLPFSPDWRWMLGRDDSPWYPAVRLFRQPALGDWEGVVAAVQAALSREVNAPRPPAPGAATTGPGRP